MKTDLLKDQKTAATLNKKGFVKIPLLNADELEAIRSFYNSQHPHKMPSENIDGIHMTTWCKDLDYKLNVKNNIEGIIKDSIDRAFKKFRALNFVFIVKSERHESEFKVHQDWNIVDETRYRSLNVWFPLYDVDKNSGALWLLEGSQNINRPIRGSAYLFPDYSDYFEEISKKATSVPLKAGEAVVFFTNTIHGSPSNNSKSPRIASCFSLVPKEAKLYIHFQPSESNPLEVYEPDDDFMYQYKNLRVDTLSIPPAEKPVSVFDSHHNPKPNLIELKPYLRQKWLSKFLNTMTR